MLMKALVLYYERDSCKSSSARSSELILLYDSTQTSLMTENTNCIISDYWLPNNDSSGKLTVKEKTPNFR